MNINKDKIINFLKVKLRYFYIYILFKFKPIVFYNNNLLRGYGKTWLAIKTASEYKLLLITSRDFYQHMVDQAEAMKEKGVIKNIPTIFGFNQHFKGFGETNAILDTNINVYNELKYNCQNIHIIGGFVFDPNYKKVQTNNK